MFTVRNGCAYEALYAVVGRWTVVMECGAACDRGVAHLPGAVARGQKGDNYLL